MTRMLVLLIAIAGCAKDSTPPAGRELPNASGGDPAAKPVGTAPPLPPDQAAAGELPPGHPPTGGEPAGLPPGHGDMGMAPSGGGGVLASVDGGRKKLGPFTLAAPKAWEEKPTTSGMRAAQWNLPADGGGKPAELVVYYFGTGGAGGVEANIDRWIGQFQQADGSASRDKATIKQSKVAGQKATLVDVAGRYATSMPGTGEQVDEADWAMTAAIVESPEGPYYFKMVGPAATVKAHGKALKAMLDSMKL